MTGEKELFARLCAAESYSAAIPSQEGIGIYNEKRLHRILKHTLCERESCFEVKIGKYIADICEDGRITEIQCASLAPLRAKLEYYLENTDCHVCVVHPIIVRKKLIRAERETGEILRIKQSPKRETLYSALAALYPIRELLSDARISVRIMSVEAEEYRYSERTRYRREGKYDADTFPTALVDALELSRPEDYSRFLPAELVGREFCAAEYAPYAKLRGRDIYSALNVLAAVGILSREKLGARVVYRAK